jgi:hypothetical protein
MCAMAILHSRFRRVFWGIPNAYATLRVALLLTITCHTHIDFGCVGCHRTEGALGSRYKLHIEQRLNHHFDVWQCRELDPSYVPTSTLVPPQSSSSSSNLTVNTNTNNGSETKAAMATMISTTLTVDNNHTNSSRDNNNTRDNNGTHGKANGNSNSNGQSESPVAKRHHGDTVTLPG